VSASTYSQRTRVIGTDTFVAFTREQAKAINDTFISQKITIKKLKKSDSLYVVKEKQYNIQDSTKRVKDSLTYFEQILPTLTEIKKLLATQIETPFKGNIEIGAGAGVSTYFGTYRPFSTAIDGKYYIPVGTGVLKYNFYKHLTTQFEVTATQVSAGPINKQIMAGMLLANYNIAPNMYSIRVGMIPVISVGYTVFGLPNAVVVGAGLPG
jgi:adenylosuccinate synthase